jgi:hypothetical protein
MAAPFAFVEAFKCPTADLRAGRLGLVLTSDGSHRWVLTCFHVLARPGGGIVDGDLLFQPDHHTSAIGVAEATRTDRLLDCAAVRTTVPSADAVRGLGRVTDRTFSNLGQLPHETALTRLTPPQLHPRLTG